VRARNYLSENGQISHGTLNLNRQTRTSQTAVTLGKAKDPPLLLQIACGRVWLPALSQRPAIEQGSSVANLTLYWDLSRTVTTVFTVLPAATALGIFGPRFNLSGHGLAPVASTFDPHDRSTTLTKTRTFQAGPTEGRAFFFLRRVDDCVNGSLPAIPVH
jgi:hypothetical protein